MRRIAWEVAARADLRRIEQQQALAILHALTDFLKTGRGDIKKLVDDKLGRSRLRIGGWRIVFRYEADSVVRIGSVADRKDAYRR